MGNVTRYTIARKKKKNLVAMFKDNSLDGFAVQTKKRNIRMKDGITIDKMVIIKPKFIENFIMHKINTKLKKLIDLLANIYDEDNNDPAGSLMVALNQIERFKREIVNKYLNYLSKEKLKKLERKIRILEEQVTMHVYMINEKTTEKEEEYENKKSR